MTGDITDQVLSVAMDGHQPELADDAFVAPGSTLIGRVYVGAAASIWYTAVLRGDTETITIGAGSNIQDGCVVHADPGFPVTIGEGVTVGHRAVLHGCTVGDQSLIGMGAVLLNGSTVGEGSLIAAGTVLLEGTHVPAGSLVAGTPGKVRRDLTQDEQAVLTISAQQYVDNAARHRSALNTTAASTTALNTR